jgi:ABC-2 type transport system ATP-binding protein
MVEPILSFQNVTKIYKDGHKAVDHVSFDVLPSDFTVLLGLNGAGKTSLISMVTGTNTITSGDIYVDGFNINQQRFEAKRFLGVMPQEVNFNPFLSVIGTLIFHGGYYGIQPQQVIETAKPLLEKARLWKKKDRLVNSLSGGMKRILMLVRALITHPKVVILDEPTANLDMEIRDIIWDLIKSLHKKGLSILLTTHNLQEAQELCDKIVIIHHGKLVFNKGIREAISNIQEQYYTLSFHEKPTKSLSFLDTCSYDFLDDHRIVLKLKPGQFIGDVLHQFHQANIQYGSVAPSHNQLEQILREAIV